MEPKIFESLSKLGFQHIEKLFCEITCAFKEASLVTRMVKNLAAMQEIWVWSLGWEDPPEKGMATHSSILTWKILWTEEPDLFTGLRELVYEIWSKLPTQGFSHSSVGKESTCNAGDPSSIPGLGRSAGEGLGYPLQYSDMENPMDWGAWRATVQGVARVGHDLVTKTTTIKPAYSPARQVMTHHHCSLLLDRLAPVRALWLFFQSLKNTWSHQRITFSNCFPLSASSKVRL